MNKEKAIIDSWKANAASWADLIDRNGIESRRLVTNQAIVKAVCSSQPKTALDLGCGEGWLSAALHANGIRVTGVDVIPALIEKAKEKADGEFIVASYEELADPSFRFQQSFDAIVINFALIGKESTEQLLAALPRYLSAGGKLFIQTLHPYSRKSMNDYQTGWKEGSWDGLGDQFTQPYQWFFRTLEDWLLLLGRAGFSQLKATDVLHPETSQPLSVIFTCSCS